MHDHDGGHGWIFTPLNHLDQFQLDRMCRSSHRFDFDGIDADDISDSVVGLKGSDGHGNELRSGVCEF